MAVGKRLNLNFQHVCYCNVASNYGHVFAGSEPAGGKEAEWSLGLGACALTPYYTVGSPLEGSSFPAPTLKLLTLRNATLPGYEVGEINDQASKGQNVIAQTCGLSFDARRHGKYAPFLVPLNRGGEGEFTASFDKDSFDNPIVNVGGMMLDLNTADLYTQQQGPRFEGYEIFGIIEHDLGNPPCFPAACRDNFGGDSNGCKGSADGGAASCNVEGVSLPGPWPDNLHPQPRILGKGWADIAQDNPKIYGESEIYWNWPVLSSNPTRVSPRFRSEEGGVRQYKAGTLTIGTLEGQDASFSWKDNYVRPVAGAPVRFQTIPICYESCERAFIPNGLIQAKEVPDLPLYKNGYFHSLVSDPVLYRYRQGTSGDFDFLYDDSNKDSQQAWLPHHKTNLVLKAEDPNRNAACALPYEGLQVEGGETVCVADNYVGKWEAGSQAIDRITYGFANGVFGRTCYVEEKCECVGGEDDCPSCQKVGTKESPNEKGYGTIETDVVRYNGCCWETTEAATQNGGTVPSYFEVVEGGWVESVDELPPGEAFDSEGQPLWKISNAACATSDGKTTCDIGKIEFGKGVEVSYVASTPGKAYQGNWDKGKKIFCRADS